MYTFSYHAIAPFISHVISISVFAFLILKNPKSALHITLGMFCLGASLWQFSTGMMFIATTDELALFWDRIVYVGVNFQWLMHFHFTVLLLKARDQRKWLLLAYALAAAFAVFTPTDYFVHDLYRYSWGCHSVAGPLHHPFVLVSTGFYMKCLYMIFMRYRETNSEVERNQYKYYMAGFTIFVSASLAYLPAYRVAIYPFAYRFESIYSLILVFIIVRHHMLDIETVIHKTLLWLTVSVTMLVPIAAIAYAAYPLLIRLDAGAFTASIAALIAAAIVLFSTIQPRIDHLFQRKKYDYRLMIDKFMGSVVTLNDREKVTRVAKDLLANAFYPEHVRIFWVTDGILFESGAPSTNAQPLQFPSSIAEYLVRHKTLIERDVVSVDPKFRGIDGAMAELFSNTGSVILQPVTGEREVQGIVALGRKSNLAPYTALDKKFLHELSVGMSLAGINSLMFETQKELFEKEREARKAQEDLVRIRDEINAELERRVQVRTEELSIAIGELNTTNNVLLSTRDALWGEMQLAKKLQTVLLPKNPQVSGYEIIAHMNPASEVGGDYYDVVNTRFGDWIVIGDVSGHGVSAGLVMMMVQTAVRTALHQNIEIHPKELLATVNDAILQNIRQMGEDKYVMIMALALRSGGVFTFSGLHQDILIYRKRTHTVETIPTSGIWLGLVSPVAEFLDNGEFTLEIGDILLLFTDGITEAVRKETQSSKQERNARFFGKSGLSAILMECSTTSLQEIKTRILASMKDYQSDDDITFVLTERTS